MKRGRDDDPIVGHLLSIYSAFKPDFAALGRAFPSLMPFLLGENKSGLDFSNPEALAELTKALLFVDFDLSVNLPPDKLCPTVTSRLNYILHISDLLKRSPRLSIKDGKYARDSFGGDSEVLGLDVGCGASAIYSLLGCRLFGWRFVCSELDPSSLAVAKANALANGMGESTIRFVQAPDSNAAFRCCFSSDQDELPMFTMCNPPFFEDVEEASQGHRNTVISDSEAATSGGEVEFVGRLIADSLFFGDKIALYSSLLGKKASLKPLQALLMKHKCPIVHTTRLEQGKTHRWVLAWSFRTPPFPRVTTRPPGVVFDELKTFLTNSGLQLKSCNRTTLTLTAELHGAFVFSFQFARDHKGRIVASTSLVEGDKDLLEEFERLMASNVWPTN